MVASPRNQNHTENKAIKREPKNRLPSFLLNYARTMRVSLNPRGHGHNFAFLHQRILAILPRALQRLPHVSFADDVVPTHQCQTGFYTSGADGTED
jgi:hypothetical protein